MGLGVTCDGRPRNRGQTPDGAWPHAFPLEHGVRRCRTYRIRRIRMTMRTITTMPTMPTPVPSASTSKAFPSVVLRHSPFPVT
jgi:hypothetical protein